MKWDRSSCWEVGHTTGSVSVSSFTSSSGYVVNVLSTATILDNDAVSGLATGVVLSISPAKNRRLAPCRTLAR